MRALSVCASQRRARAARHASRPSSSRTSHRAPRASVRPRRYQPLDFPTTVRAGFTPANAKPRPSPGGTACPCASSSRRGLDGRLLGELRFVEIRSRPPEISIYVLPQQALRPRRPTELLRRLRGTKTLNSLLRIYQGPYSSTERAGLRHCYRFLHRSCASVPATLIGSVSRNRPTTMIR